MFHYFKWTIRSISDKTLLINDSIGIQISYAGSQKQGEFYLYPYIDDNKKSVFYFAFDTIQQKIIFEDLLKVSWIWPKTAFQIAQLWQDSLHTAIKNYDVKFFQNIPWIWPKTAKKMLLELKWSFDFEDIQQIDIDQKLYKDIVKSLKWFGYDADKIKSCLLKYDSKISKENMWEVIKRVISQI